jgi:hypothetical protein
MNAYLQTFPKQTQLWVNWHLWRILWWEFVVFHNPQPTTLDLSNIIRFVVSTSIASMIGDTYTIFPSPNTILETASWNQRKPKEHEWRHVRGWMNESLQFLTSTDTLSGSTQPSRGNQYFHCLPPMALNVLCEQWIIRMNSDNTQSTRSCVARKSSGPIEEQEFGASLRSSPDLFHLFGEICAMKVHLYCCARMPSLFV